MLKYTLLSSITDIGNLKKFFDLIENLIAKSF